MAGHLLHNEIAIAVLQKRNIGGVDKTERKENALNTIRVHWSSSSSTQKENVMCSCGCKPRKNRLLDTLISFKGRQKLCSFVNATLYCFANPEGKDFTEKNTITWVVQRLEVKGEPSQNLTFLAEISFRLRNWYILQLNHDLIEL